MTGEIIGMGDMVPEHWRRPTTRKEASKNHQLMPGIPRSGGLWRQGWRQEASREGFTASATTGLLGVGRRMGVLRNFQKVVMTAFGGLSGRARLTKFAVLIMLVLVVVSTGCGQKTDLRLPKDDPEETQ